ncbi:MAG: quinone-dependent dihydroorotate dehydrogenase [Betaproteobacteria bacterium]|jgi:dihydroorotate dehydrogenase|nr:quinone-dependent dihydroorotate dehydrogenase [Betaproteobacteria bacterium]NBP44168.1 quinone-dependent dihydroorotate dehydrogenase [Betaproteobacteria bacterium]
MPSLYDIARCGLFSLDPEAAHDLTLGALQRFQNTPLQALYAQPLVHDPVDIAGLRFPNRVGLAAGLDKNAACIDAFAAMGFGFVEVGTVTPLAQPGNPKPRMFRLAEHKALINRLGFNNLGLAQFIANVQRSRVRNRPDSKMILGLNIGKNAATPIERALDDYLLGLEGVFPYADYVTINISSPNTKNLRSLQSDEALNQLLLALDERRHALQERHHRQVPLFLKIAPDLDEEGIAVIAHSLKARVQSQSTGRWGLIATNTTVARDAVAGHTHASETGGLSGQPVLAASNRVIQAMRQALGTDFPIMGVGGVLSGADAISKRAAGADLVQIYTGLIYKGPPLVREVAQALAQVSR